MVDKAPVCIFKSPVLSEDEACKLLSLNIPNYPREIFKFIDFEDVEKFKYFITSYGRIFTNYGRELFPEPYKPPKQNNIYLRIELSCTSYLKRRKIFVHRLVANAFIPKSNEDILLGRDLVNHKFNMDGRCNFAWNLEWANDSENTLHGLYFKDDYDISLFDHNVIMNRRSMINYDQNGDANPKSRISEFQAHLICYAYTVLGYNPQECAIYAWLEGNNKDILLVRSIIDGYVWNHVSIQYGIHKKNRTKPKRAIPIRPEKKEEYDNIRNAKRR